MRTCCIYALLDPRSDEIRYVGKAKDPAHRLGVHLYSAKTGKSQDNRSHKYNWIRELLREGLAPELVVLESGLDDPIASERERHWIADLRQAGHRLTNHTDVAKACSALYSLLRPAPKSALRSAAGRFRKLRSGRPK